MVQFIRSDLDFILQQILYADQLTQLTAPDGSLSSADILSVLPNVQVPWGLRTVDGSFNNLVISEALGIDQTLYGAADTLFPRLTTPVFQDADPVPAGSLAPARQLRTPRPAASYSTPIRASSPT